MMEVSHSPPLQSAMHSGMQSLGASSNVTPRVSTMGTKQMAGTCEPPMSAREKLQRAQKLFTDKHSAEMYDRQVAAIESICDNNYAGFLLQDLDSVHPIVTLCNERITQTGQPMFVEPLCRLLQLCMQPFLVTGVVEDERCSGALSLLLKAIARCLYCPVLRVQMTAAETLMPFVHVIDPDKELHENANPVGARRARLQHHVIAQSGIVPLISSVLKSLQDGAPRTLCKGVS